MNTMLCFMEDQCPKIHTVSEHCPTNFIATISGTLKNPCITLTCINGSTSFSINCTPRHLAALTDVVGQLNDHIAHIQQRQHGPSARWCMHTVVVKT